jgi:hypothetical protein
MPAAYAAMVVGVEEELDQRSLVHRWIDAAVEVDIPEHGTMRLGMRNLSRVIMSGAPEDWREDVADHMTVIDQILVALSRDMVLDDVKDMLRVKIIPGAEFSGAIVERPLAPGMRLGVIVDRPDSIETVTRRTADRWGVPDADLFDMAISKMPPLYPASQETYHIDGLDIVVVDNRSCYGATSGVLALPLLVGDDPLGALVGVPNRDTMAFHKVVGLRSIAASQTLVASTASIAERSPYTISRIPYWWHRGVFEPLVEVDAPGGVALLPPPGLLKLLGVVGIKFGKEYQGPRPVIHGRKLN